jgi:hypothetical protein
MEQYCYFTWRSSLGNLTSKIYWPYLSTFLDFPLLSFRNKIQYDVCNKPIILIPVIEEFHLIGSTFLLQSNLFLESFVQIIEGKEY